MLRDLALTTFETWTLTLSLQASTQHLNMNAHPIPTSLYAALEGTRDFLKHLAEDHHSDWLAEHQTDLSKHVHSLTCRLKFWLTNLSIPSSPDGEAQLQEWLSRNLVIETYHKRRSFGLVRPITGPRHRACGIFSNWSIHTFSNENVHTDYTNTVIQTDFSLRGLCCRWLAT